ncbi:MAG: lipid IV(A) 3-deoxy-D-manno-octulosonic acid transferase [Gammaproteobacteria bacterium]
MNRFAYNILFTLVLPVIVLRLLWRAIKAPAYARRWGERFGAPRLSAQQQAMKGKWLWLHAVSVGETLAAAPLVRKLLADHPELPIVMTTMTPTGSERVRALFGDSICHVYAPYDHPLVVNRFLRRFQPHTVVIMETELWPNIIHCSKALGARVIVANARLSEKSFRGYEKFARLGKPMLQAIDCIAAQGEADAQRFERLGVPRERLRVTGSIKFEIDLPDDLAQKREAMKASFAGNRPVLIAASTREGEEEHVLRAFRQCLQTMPDLLLILVPRHPERFKSVARLCEQNGLTLVKRSEHSVVTEKTQVFLGDSMGEMLTYFSVSDVAFVGGSLVNTGCHNVLEPAALGLPVLVGPSQFNFQSICEQLESAGALKTVADANGLAQAVVQVFADESLRQSMGAAGRQLIEENRGALQRIEDIVWQAADDQGGKP